MLNRDEFNILYNIKKNANITQRSLAKQCGVSLGKINSGVSLLKGKGYLSKEGRITQYGLDALKPYKVKNAIILAAGFSSRCRPLSYEKPKGLFKVKDEILIERQIKQLFEKNICDIYVVVGYKKELFFYLERKYGVHIIVNSEYAERNNTSSVFAAKEIFGNSYICYSDNYINLNGYESYVYQSYFAVMYSNKYTDEYVVKFNKNGLITNYYQGDINCWYQMGEMYFDNETAQTFLNLLKIEYNYPSIYDMKIDDFYIRHMSNFDIYIKQYPENAILEFDTISDIKSFDEKFIQNMGDNILTNICNTLKCKDNDISNIVQIHKGLTNMIFSFECNGNKYIYRQPGIGTDKIIDREKEFLAQQIAKDRGLDSSLIACNPQKGWKICKFLENIEFSYEDKNDIKKGIALIKKMHSKNNYTLGWEFNMLEQAEKIQNQISSEYYDSHKNFVELQQKITELYYLIKKDNIDIEMCHNDICPNNILIGKNETYLIDWEYAGDNDPAADICSFIINYNFSDQQCDEILNEYLGHIMTLQEKRHYYGYIAVTAYFYFSWAIYMESRGNNIGNFTYIWFNYAIKYGDEAMALYKIKNNK